MNLYVKVNNHVHQDLQKSIIVNEVIRTILSQLFTYFFYNKILNAQKQSKNKQTKQNKTNKKQWRQQFFVAQKLLRG